MTNKLEGFRLATRQWLEENCPPSMRSPMPAQEIPWGGRNPSFPNSDTKVWLERMVEKRWTAPMWPEEYGGAGLNIDQAQVLEQELVRISARPALFSFGLWMLGPVLLESASDDQKKRLLPAIVRGETRWCQGYSEPGAGSDLASLKTKAELRGDHFVINGSKIWTSGADQSDWIFCLVRTDFKVPKHLGVSFLLFDLNSPGVDRKPIKLISGESDFCQTFFDDVKVPVENLVGELNGGWKIAKRLLEFERKNVAGDGFGATHSRTLWEMAQAHTDDPDGQIEPELRARIASQLVHAEAVDDLADRMAKDTSGNSASLLASVLKVAAAKSNQLRSELAVEAMGAAGLGWDDSNASAEDLTETRSWLRSKGNSIEGGTTEINLNIIAKRVLDLPDPK